MIRHSDFSERMIMLTEFFSFWTFGYLSYRNFKAITSSIDENTAFLYTSCKVRCALTVVFVNMYDGNQNFDKKRLVGTGFVVVNLNWLIIILLPGSLYMATLGFFSTGTSGR